MSHSPYVFTDPEEWTRARDRRKADGGIAADIPVESQAEMEAKKHRCETALGLLRDRFRQAEPDVVIVFGDDQLEQFAFSGFPAFGIFCGEHFAGYKISRRVGLPTKAARATLPKTPEHWTTIGGHPELARGLMVGLVREGFDPAFSLELADDEEGMGHAFMRPLTVLTPAYDLPAVPISVNCYYGPQPTGKRCRDLGTAVRRVVESLPNDLRVAVVGSGGLWHTPMRPQATLDGSFDEAVLDALRRGDASAMATAFDDLGNGLEMTEQELMIESGGTGMVLGIGLGTGETRNWIAAAATAGGASGTVIDYIPVYASPIGLAFAYFEL
jgi:3-O-methylgallate 3,4-dioxygenase